MVKRQTGLKEFNDNDFIWHKTFSTATGLTSHVFLVCLKYTPLI